LVITDTVTIDLLTSILLKVIDKHDYTEINSLSLLDSNFKTVLNSINSCHVYQSWRDEDIEIAQSTLSILDNPHLIRIYTIFVELTQYRLNNSSNVSQLIQFLIKFCTDRTSNPNFGFYVSSFLQLEPKGYIKQMIEGLKILSNFVTNGTKLKVEIMSKLKKLNNILVIYLFIPGSREN